MVDTLNSLWFHSFICCDYYDGNISKFSSSCTHYRKGLMSRSIKESYLLSVFVYLICSDLLCDSTCFSCCNLCFPYVVKYGSLTMIYMPHYAYHRCSCRLFHRIIVFEQINQVSFQKTCYRNVILLLFHDFYVEDFRNYETCIEIDSCVKIHHHSVLEKLSDDLRYRYSYLFRKFLDCKKILQSYFLTRLIDKRLFDIINLPFFLFSERFLRSPENPFVVIFCESPCFKSFLELGTFVLRSCIYEFPSSESFFFLVSFHESMFFLSL